MDLGAELEPNLRHKGCLTQMAKQIWLNRLTWFLQIALAGVFLNAAFRKFTDHAVPVETFQALGMDPWFRYVTGCLELTGGTGLLIRSFSGLAAIGLATIMVGAIATHLFFVPGSIWPASLLLMSLLLVAALRREEISHQIKMRFGGSISSRAKAKS
jgi:putative oxidoreductase